MTALWDHRSVRAALGVESSRTFEASSVAIDSRTLEKGAMFVAIKGERFDGHAYLKQSFERGASAAIVSSVPDNISAECPLIVVPDTMEALNRLGHEARRRSRAKVVGITGSVGKTSAKEMMKTVLSTHAATYATSGNYNNHIGTPLNLANMPSDATYGVFEMGMNHEGEIAHLARMVRPHVAMITTVEAVHLEFFNSVEEIADAKAEIFEGMEKAGIVVLNADNPYLERLKRSAANAGIHSVVTFGEHTLSDYHLLNYRIDGMHSVVSASIQGKAVNYRLGTIGKHWAKLSLAVLAMAQAVGCPLPVAMEALAGFCELAGRGRLVSLSLSDGEVLVVDDSYNASPASMCAAFAKTAEVHQASRCKGRMVAVLGQMLELGSQAPAMHADLSKHLQRSGFDKVFTSGALMQHLHDALPLAMRGAHVMEAVELIPLINDMLQAGDVVLLKGSHGSKIYQVAEAMLCQQNSAGRKAHVV